MKSTSDFFFFPDHAVPVLWLSVLDTAPLAAKSVITPLLTGYFYNHGREEKSASASCEDISRDSARGND